MRIIGGVHRSRLLRSPKGVSTRPTSDRVREAMFSILDSHRTLEGARVLDLYAGTGALGLEALSRGARWVTFVECSRSALDALRANVGALGVEQQVRIVPALAERSADTVVRDAPFDFILADPPYALVRNGEVAETLGVLVRKSILTSGARVVLEHGKGDVSPSIDGLSLPEARRYGDTMLAFYAGTHSEAEMAGDDKR
jgi:16S rRNA (guanine966-N2)-methyltransferase